MEIKEQLIFIISALGGINGLALGGYFLLKRNEKRLSDYFLGGFLIAMSIRTTKSAFIHFNPMLFEFFIQFGLFACFLIGPFLLLYVLSLSCPNLELKKRWWLHIIPYLIIFCIFSWNNNYHDNQRSWWTFIEWIYTQWLIYLIISGFFLRKIFKKVLQRNKLDDHEFWILNIFIGSFIVWLAYETSNYTSYIVGALSFTFVFYIALLLFFFKKENKQIASDVPLKYAGSTLSDEEVGHYYKKLSDVFINEKPYLDSSLSLEKLSNSISLTPKELSQVINQSTGKNFSQIIATLRIEEVKERFQLTENNHLRIAAIAFDCGFNSISSFNNHFKKITGQTAKEYRNTLPNS